jgi:hypothetical protein
MSLVLSTGKVSKSPLRRYAIVLIATFVAFGMIGCRGNMVASRMLIGPDIGPPVRLEGKYVDLDSGDTHEFKMIGNGGHKYKGEEVVQTYLRKLIKEDPATRKLIDEFRRDSKNGSKKERAEVEEFAQNYLREFPVIVERLKKFGPGYREMFTKSAQLGNGWFVSQVAVDSSNVPKDINRISSFTVMIGEVKTDAIELWDSDVCADEEALKLNGLTKKDGVLDAATTPDQFRKLILDCINTGRLTKDRSSTKLTKTG